VDVIRVDAPSAAHARRLVGAIDGKFSAGVAGDPGTVVELRLDSDTSEQLVDLFDTLGRWLTEGDLSACRVRFGERSLTLLPVVDGRPNDPADFLLERTIQLQIALDSRIVIEQAKGILAERQAIGVEAAFEQMRREARSRRMRLHDLASGVVATVAGVRSTDAPAV
jgi:hypothetical protein